MSLRALLGSACILAFLSPTSFALIVVDLRFDDGSKSRHISPGMHTVEVWAQLSGDNTTGTDEGLTYIYGSVQSQQIGGGAILSGNSGIISNSAFGPRFTTVEPMGVVGIPMNASADGVQDWGDPSNMKHAIKFNAHTPLLGVDQFASPVFYNMAGVTANLLNEGQPGAGVEFKVGEFVVGISSADIAANAHGVTLFNWSRYVRNVPPGQIHRVDGNTSENGRSHPMYYLPSVAGVSGNSVAFTVNPEPSSACLVLGLLALAGLRRQHRAFSAT